MKKLKKNILIIFTILIVFILQGCSKSIHETLQANDWQVVSTNGESYTGSFSTDTASFDVTLMQVGFQYALEEKDGKTIINMTHDENDKPSFEIVKGDKGELKFIATNDTTFDQYGDLTLSPIEKTESQAQ